MPVTAKTMPSEVTEVLDQIEAYNDFHRVGGVSKVLSELAAHFGHPYIRAYEWVIVRKHPPKIERYLAMQKWIAVKLKLIPRKEKARYNQILRIVRQQNQNKRNQ